MGVMLPNEPTPHIFSVLRDIYGVQADELDALDMKAYISRIRGIHHGLSAEHEFAALASWLGNPRLIIHADEVLATDNHFRVPDFLIVARRGGEDIPFLVEVKSGERGKKLVWSEDYLDSMRGFANMLKLPILVAWKPFGFWILSDTVLFEKKTTAYHLDAQVAMKSNLMTALLGNVFIKLKEGFRLEIHFKLIDSEHAANPLLPPGEYPFEIVESSLYTATGQLSSELNKQLFPIFLTRATDQSETVRTGAILRQTWTTDSDSMFAASDIMLTNFSWHKEPGEKVDWLTALRKGQVTPNVDLPNILERGIQAGAIRYVFEQQPQVIPAFLEGINWRTLAQ